MTYPCSLCSMKYQTGEELNAHLRAKHNIDVLNPTLLGIEINQVLA